MKKEISLGSVDHEVQVLVEAVGAPRVTADRRRASPRVTATPRPVGPRGADSKGRAGDRVSGCVSRVAKLGHVSLLPETICLSISVPRDKIR